MSRTATPIPISSLDPSDFPPAQYTIKGVITLSWPYSSSTQQCAFLLSDPDFRLRSKRGQVRVRFTRGSAKAVAQSRLGIGDVVEIGLAGGAWELEDEGVKARTPGRGVEGELVFGRKGLKLRVWKGGDSGHGERVDVASEVDEKKDTARTGEDAQQFATPVPAPSGKGKELLRRSLDSSFLNGTGAAWTYSSPAFVKRMRLSGTEKSLLDSVYDPFVDEGEGSMKKRQSFGPGLKWRVGGRSPSPVNDIFVETAKDAGNADDMEMEPPSQSQSVVKSVTTKLEKGRASQTIHVDTVSEHIVEPESRDTATASEDVTTTSPAAPRGPTTISPASAASARKRSASPTPLSSMPPPPLLPRLSMPANDRSQEIQQAQRPGESEGPSTPILGPVKSPNLPLPSPFPTDSPPSLAARLASSRPRSFSPHSLFGAVGDAASVIARRRVSSQGQPQSLPASLPPPKHTITRADSETRIEPAPAKPLEDARPTVAEAGDPAIAPKGPSEVAAVDLTNDSDDEEDIGVSVRSNGDSFGLAGKLDHENEDETDVEDEEEDEKMLDDGFTVQHTQDPGFDRSFSTTIADEEMYDDAGQAFDNHAQDEVPEGSFRVDSHSTEGPQAQLAKPATALSATTAASPGASAASPIVLDDDDDDEESHGLDGSVRGQELPEDEGDDNLGDAEPARSEIHSDEAGEKVMVDEASRNEQFDFGLDGTISPAPRLASIGPPSRVANVPSTAALSDASRTMSVTRQRARAATPGDATASITHVPRTTSQSERDRWRKSTYRNLFGLGSPTKDQPSATGPGALDRQVERYIPGWFFEVESQRQQSDEIDADVRATETVHRDRQGEQTLVDRARADADLLDTVKAADDIAVVDEGGAGDGSVDDGEVRQQTSQVRPATKGDGFTMLGDDYLDDQAAQQTLGEHIVSESPPLAEADIQDADEPVVEQEDGRDQIRNKKLDLGTALPSAAVPPASTAPQSRMQVIELDASSDAEEDEQASRTAQSEPLVSSRPELFAPSPVIQDSLEDSENEPAVISDEERDARRRGRPEAAKAKVEPPEHIPQPDVIHVTQHFADQSEDEALTPKAEELPTFERAAEEHIAPPRTAAAPTTALDEDPSSESEQFPSSPILRPLRASQSQEHRPSTQPTYPTLPPTPSDSQSFYSQSQPTIRQSSARSKLPPTPQLTQRESTLRSETRASQKTPAPQLYRRESSLRAEVKVAESPLTPQAKTPSRRSARLRTSNVPDVLSEWFSPRGSGVAGEQKWRDARDGTSQSDGHPTPSKRKSILGHTGGFATAYSYFTPLSKLPELVNPASQAHAVDILAVVTDATKEPVRAKSGPKDYFTVFHIADPSLTFTALFEEQEHDHRVRAEIFRPYKHTLPVAHAGDVLLLRALVVKSKKRTPYLLSTDASAWCIWRYPDAKELDKPIWARKGGESSVVEEQINGPPVEFGEEERRHAGKLREWWVDERAGEGQGVDGPAARL